MRAMTGVTCANIGSAANAACRCALILNATLRCALATRMLPTNT